MKHILLFVTVIILFNCKPEKEEPKPTTLSSVITGEVTSITSNSATAAGQVVTDGNLDVTERGIVISGTIDPTTSDTKIISGTGIGTFSVDLTELIPGTIYHVRAFATNSIGTTYGLDKSFSTDSTLPTLTTTEVTDITAFNAKSGGIILDDGGSEILTRGVCWNLVGNPTILDNKTTDGNGMGVFNSSISGLKSSSIIYIRAYATNGRGVAYGNEISFSTISVNLNDGLVAYFPFNGDATDSTANSNHGYVNSGVSLADDRFSKTNSAYMFSGGTIVVPHKTYLAIPQVGEFSLSIWVQKTGYENPVHIIGKRLPGAHEFNWLLGQHTTPGGAPGGGLAFVGVTNSTEVGIGYNGISDSTIKVNKWEHLTGTYNDGSWRLYKNGELVAQKISSSYAPYTGTPDLEIGNCGGWGAFIGLIDDIRIYNRELSADEVKALFQLPY